MRQRILDLGLSQIDAVALATDVDSDIGADLDISDIRYVSFWSELIDESFNFKDSLSFPLFISKSIRYLANQEPWYAYLAAGQPYEQTSGSSLASTDLLSEYAVGASYVRNEAGSFELDDGSSLHVSLLDSTATLPSPSVGSVSTNLETSAAQGAWGLATWLILLVLVLLGGEWYLFQRGLMP